MDKKSTIIHQAARLPIQVRKEICVSILQSIDRDEAAIDAVTRFGQLVREAEGVFGVMYDPDRKATGDTYIRNVCAWQMRREGYTLSQIGKAMGRHTSSVVAMDHRGNDMQEGFFGPYAKDKFNEFIKRV